jgi:uroporphyrinogen decarboxylase
MGVSGYFHATFGAIAPGQPRGISAAVFEHFVRPFDLQILDAAEGLVRVLHAHGSGVLLERLQGYPFEVLHLADRTPGNPTLTQLRQWTPRCLMGGVDERTFTGLSVPELRQQVGQAIAQAGSAGLIVAPGCALAPSSSGRLLRTLRG